MDTITESVEMEAAPDAAVEFLADPRHLPAWAPAFADEVAGDEQQGWRVVKGGRAFDLRVVVSRAGRTVQYLREVAPGREGGASLRVLPHKTGGSVIEMTLPVGPGADPANVAATLRAELTALARLVGEA